MRLKREISDLNDQSDIERICRELAQAFQGILSWKWDRRFETILSEFGVDRQHIVRSILERHLNFIWDGSNVANAPQMIRTIDDSFGGLRPGQFLFTSGLERDALIFGAWWPWGDGKEISIRIGLAFKDIEDFERVEKIQWVKGWFGL